MEEAQTYNIAIPFYDLPASTGWRCGSRLTAESFDPALIGRTFFIVWKIT